MLKSARISKIRIIVPKDYYDTVLTALHDMGVMQIEPASPETTKTMKSGESTYYNDMTSYAQRFRSLESMLKPRNYKKFSFRDMNELVKKADSVKIDDELVDLTKNISDTKAEVKSNEELTNLVSEMKGFEGNIAILTSKRVISFLIRNPHEENTVPEVKIMLQEQFNNAIIFELKGGLLVSIKRSDESGFARQMEHVKAKLSVIPNINGKVEEVLFRLQKEHSALIKEAKKMDDHIDRLSTEYYPAISAIREQLDIEVRKQEITTKLGQSTFEVAIEGWIPSRRIDKVEAVISNLTNKKYLLERMNTKLQPPTMFDNPIIARIYEFFIRFYSIPKSNEVDPTIIFAIVFPIFFGFMVGDAGYGVIMLLVSSWLIHRIRHPVKTSLIPKKITSFVHTIVSNDSLVFLAKAIIPGALIAIIFGILFNQYFGFQLGYTAPFSVEMNVGKLLVIAGWTGVGMVSFGLILGFINNITIGRKKEAIGKLGWLAAGWGIVIIGLNVLHMQPLGIISIVSAIPYALLIGGVATFLLSEGLNSLLELPSLVNHMPSRQSVHDIIKEFNVGDRVTIVQKGTFRNIPHPRYKGKTGIVIEKRGRPYIVALKIMRADVKLIVPSVHLEKAA